MNNTVKSMKNDSSFFAIRHASEKDAKKLAALRLQCDGETEYLDRVKGEDYMDTAGFRQLIQKDAANDRNLFLVAEAGGELAGFSRCQGNNLIRTAHQVEFGICLLKKYWSLGIGKNLLQESIMWADQHDIKKMTLKVLEINEQAVRLYRKNGFEIEGILKRDKLLSDGIYYSTLLMARFHPQDCN